MKNLRSASVTQGVEKAPMRSLFYAMGYTKEELDRPLIGVVSAHSEIVPGHFHLDKVAEAVKAGIRMAGGTPIEVPAIGGCDGIAMGHILSLIHIYQCHKSAHIPHLRRVHIQCKDGLLYPSYILL